MSSLGGFLRAAGAQYGHIVNWNTQNTLDQENIQLKQQQIDTNTTSNDAAAQQLEARKRIGAQIAAEQQAAGEKAQDPAQQGEIFRKAEVDYLKEGDYESSARAGVLADQLFTQSRQATLDNGKKAQTARETLASNALNYLNAPTPALASEVARSAVAAGVNPLDIPKPNTPEFGKWARTQQEAALSSKDRLERATAEAAAATKRQDQLQFHADLQANREATRAQTAATQAGIADARRDRAAESDARRDFKATEKLTSTLQTAAKPYLEDRQLVTTVKDWLAADTSVGDQQVHQALSSLNGHFKGRATNLFYKDNKNFGDAVDKVFGWASQTFTGRYSEKARHEISQMLDGMETTVIDPALTRLEAQQKTKAKKYQLDPDLVEIQGDFNRRHAPTATTPDAAVKGEYRKTADGRTLLRHPDGTIEVVK